MKCANCSAIMEVDLERRMATCSYCGNKQILKDSDAVEIERLRTEAHKEIELAKLKQVKPKGKKGLIALLVITIVLFLASFGQLMEAELILGLFTLAQAVALLVAWFLFKKGKGKKLAIGLIILSFILIFPFSYISDMEKKFQIDWPDTAMTQMLPEPISKYGYVTRSTPTVFECELDEVQAESYKGFLAEVKARGFTIVDDNIRGHYEAFNKDGYFLSLFFYETGGHLYITLSAPLKLTELSWPPTELANNIPKPPSTKGLVEKLSSNSFLITIGDVDEEDFHNYMMSLIAHGYDGYSYEKGKFKVSTRDGKGNNIMLRYFVNNTMKLDFYISESK